MNSSLVRVLGTSDPVEAALAGDDHPLGEVPQHRVGGLAERAPGEGARRPPGLDPDDLTPQEQAQAVLQDAHDVHSQRAVGLAPEVGHVHRDPAPGLQHPGTLRRTRPPASGGSRGRSQGCDPRPGPARRPCREVRRRGHHEGHRTAGHPGHGPGVAGDDDIGLERRLDRGVIGQLRRGEPGVEVTGVVVGPAGHAEGGRGRGLATVGHGSPPGPGLAPDPRCYGPISSRSRIRAHATDHADHQ